MKFLLDHDVPDVPPLFSPSLNQKLSTLNGRRGTTALP